MCAWCVSKVAIATQLTYTSWHEHMPQTGPNNQLKPVALWFSVEAQSTVSSHSGQMCIKRHQRYAQLCKGKKEKNNHV